ncbi:MAG TPA: DEAD/DEAH box helicase [Sediminibacterium sp.]|nr:DEAD/DEAH box helicase [Sediminibacterium sp.]
MKFEDLSLIAPLLNALHEQGYESPTPIQQQVIPFILQQRDVLACAQTGTGKTAAFSLPILQLLYLQKKQQGPSRSISALVLAPTRELAIQIEESCHNYGAGTGIRTLAIFGGVSQHGQVQSLRKGVDILVATPGRLLDLLQQQLISLSHIRILVLDEADRMLDMGFVRDVRKITALLPKQRQTLFFSATMPADIQELSKSMLINPARVSVAPVSSTAESIDQQLYFVEKADKKSLLVHLLQTGNIPSALIFTETKHGADKLCKMLCSQQIPAKAIHGNKSQNARQQALQYFRNGEVNILVATDIAARGIDIDQLPFVINYELPNVPETYVHRIGRTGRAGATGKAISFCSTEEKVQLKDIHKLIAKPIPVVLDHPYQNQVHADEHHPVRLPQQNKPGKRNAGSRQRRFQTSRHA